MTKLLLISDRHVVKEYPFMQDSLTIGRKPENTISIDNLTVSGYHARIHKAGQGYILTDLQSTNGTFVNDKPITSHELKNGDSVTLGRQVLLFVAGDNEAKDAKAQMDLAGTMVHDPVRRRMLLLRRRGRGIQPPKARKIGVLSTLDGQHPGDFALTKKVTRLGKSPNSEMKLSGMFMGGTAATIRKNPSGYSITFAGGLTKLKVNGKAVKGSALLKDFDTIELGSNRFQFRERTPGNSFLT